MSLCTGPNGLILWPETAVLSCNPRQGLSTQAANFAEQGTTLDYGYPWTITRDR